jgi:hypothetical protein
LHEIHTIKPLVAVHSQTSQVHTGLYQLNCASLITAW